MFLHAWRMTLPHPVSGEPLAIEAEVPDTLQAFLARLYAAEPPDFDRLKEMTGMCLGDLCSKRLVEG